MEEVDGDDGVLDPRIQIELENLNTSTDEINRLEIELDEANTTFRILLNECTRRLKLKSKSLGSCIERARPYYEALDVARQAQLECQRAAVQYQRANEIHQAAKETVALAEQRFLSKQHEWQFDNAWQEMLNHATIKVRDAETQKAESGREHHKRAMLFNAAEQKVQQLEQRLHRQIIKSRPYFEEKALCNGQLAAQKERVESLQAQVAAVKSAYAASLKELERISEEIHCKRSRNKNLDVEQDPPCGPREPGVGAERSPIFTEQPVSSVNEHTDVKENVDSYLPLKDKSELCMSSGTELATQEAESSNESKTSSSYCPMTSLPLLENLAMLKMSESSDLFKKDPSQTNHSGPTTPQKSSGGISNEFGEQHTRFDSVKSDFSFSPKSEAAAGGTCSHMLLSQLMETYESELDRCDLASLSGMSVATSSSAVSEKDENETLADEEEFEELRERVKELTTQSSSSGCIDFSAHSKAPCSSCNQTPSKKSPTGIKFESSVQSVHQTQTRYIPCTGLPVTPLAPVKSQRDSSSLNQTPPNSSVSLPTSPVVTVKYGDNLPSLKNVSQLAPTTAHESSHI